MSYLKDRVRARVNAELNKAEAIWKEVGPFLQVHKLAEASAESIPSHIPGHSEVNPVKPKVDNFVCINVDIRDSTKHLMNHSGPEDKAVTGIQRIYYESTALFAGVYEVLEFYDGSITEFLGDGILGFFSASEDPQRSSQFGLSAGRDILKILTEEINPILFERYELPDMQIGVGLSLGRAFITTVGSEHHQHPKAIGESVFYASKICTGKNSIHVSEAFREALPTRNDGKGLEFISIKTNDQKAYKLVE